MDMASVPVPTFQFLLPLPPEARGAQDPQGSAAWKGAALPSPPALAALDLEEEIDFFRRKRP